MLEETMTMKTLLRLAFEHPELLSGVLMTSLVRPEVACVEWSKDAPSLVSRAVSNPSLRHRQR